MKITPKPPALPNLVDVTKTPAAPSSIPVPYPNAPASSFTPAPGGFERRYSVRFLQSIPQRLAMAGVDGKQAEALMRRFHSMIRSELDREGRAIDGIMASSHPREGLAMYDLFARLGSAVTPGGFRVQPNIEKTWTITPPGADPFVFGAKGEKQLSLADGTALTAAGPGALDVGGHVLALDLAARVGMVGVEVALNSMAITATVLTMGAAPVAGALAQALPAVIDALKREQGAGLEGTQHAMYFGVALASALTARATEASIGLASSVIATVAEGANGPAGALQDRLVGFRAKLTEALEAASERQESAASQAMTTITTGVLTIVTNVGGAQQRLAGLLGATSRCAAPSRRNDPEAERAAVLATIGAAAPAIAHPPTRDAALQALEALGDRLRGSRRDDAMAHLQRVLQGQQQALQMMSSLSKSFHDTAMAVIRKIG